VAKLGERAEKVRTRAVGPDEDNMLRSPVTAAGQPSTCASPACPRKHPARQRPRQAGSPRYGRLTGTPGTGPPNGRPTRSAGRCKLVFCDLGTPGPAGTYTTNSVTSSPPAGYPANPSGSSTRPRTDRDKAQLFAACRSGSIAVLVGSTRRWVSAPTSRTGPSPCITSTPPGGPPTSRSGRDASSARATSIPRFRSCGT